MEGYSLWEWGEDAGRRERGGQGENEGGEACGGASASSGRRLEAQVGRRGAAMVLYVAVTLGDAAPPPPHDARKIRCNPSLPSDAAPREEMAHLG